MRKSTSAIFVTIFSQNFAKVDFNIQYVYTKANNAEWKHTFQCTKRLFLSNSVWICANGIFIGAQKWNFPSKLVPILELLFIKICVLFQFSSIGVLFFRNQWMLSIKNFNSRWPCWCEKNLICFALWWFWTLTFWKI